MVTYPKEWQIKSVSEFAAIGTGCRDTQDNVVGGIYPFFVRSNNIESINIADYECEAVLTAGDGVGTGKVFHYINGKFAAHQRVYVIRDFSGISGKYFYYFFSNNFRKEVEKYTAKSSVDSVRRAMIADMEVPIPSVSEQQKIVAALSDVDELILNLEKLIEKKTAIKQGVMQELLSGKRRLDGFSAVWKQSPLSDICKVYDGTHQTPTYTSQGVRFVSVENIEDIYESNKYISEHDFYLGFKATPEPGDILMTRIGDIGTSTVVTKKERLAYYVSLALFKEIKINSHFLNHYIMSSEFKKGLDERTLHHATPKKINKGEIGKCVVRYPEDISEQKAIAEVLDDFSHDILQLTQQRNKCLSLKQGMMNELLTGRTRLI
ncbi:restriction endonuclease subunit S [Olegusella massiliensis]|uniref:restriction endonuclease subunit S n=1 Tax=Olegusella massiliensis TaxID=1776381 RepID=UPI000837DF40|nr:restriction endonuclease subunit S [Olegusella massiliensis]